jgi:hypothetical protein
MCQVPDCKKTAQNAGHGRWRKANWVREEFGVEEGYVCQEHHSTNYGINGWQYKKFRKTYCENIDGRIGGIKCTATIVYEGQLQVDHIDGNPTNNDESNLQTLCANCHTHKTYLNEDYASAGRKALHAA